MKAIRKSTKIGLCVLMAACTLVPPAALAEDSTTQPFPRNNVAGGAIATRRPGSWIQDGVSNFVERQDASLNAYGGITISETEPTDSFRDIVLPGLVDDLLSVINQLALAIQAAIKGATSS